MVNIIENKAVIDGVVNAINDNAGPHGATQIELKLVKSSDVEGFPNLAKADEGSTIRINVRPEEISGLNLTLGQPFSASVRKAFAQQYFIDSIL